MTEWMRQNWSWVLSAGSFLSGLAALAKRKCRARKKRMDALEKGVQALLRAGMISEYHYCTERGRAPLYARDNFQNLWEQYEALGANGVMNDIRERFMALPIGEKEEE